MILVIALITSVSGAAYAQYPSDELSFDGDYELYTATVGGVPEVKVHELPRLDCIGLPGYADKLVAEAIVPRLEELRSGVAAKAVQVFSAGQFDASVEALQSEAATGAPVAAYTLGCLMEGLAKGRFSGPEAMRQAPHPQREDVERAIKRSRQIVPEPRPAWRWIELAALAGYPPAQWELARRDWTVRYSPFVAVDWLRHLVSKKSPRAMTLLARLYDEGRRAPRDEAEAFRLASAAASARDTLAMRMLASFHSKGTFVNPDEAQAAKWLRAAADLGDVKAQLVLARAFLTGRGVQADKREAAHWFRKAAERGSPQAAYAAGAMLRDGDGIDPDPAEASRLLHQALQAKECNALLEKFEADTLPVESPLEDWRIEQELSQFSQCRWIPDWDPYDEVFGEDLPAEFRNAFEKRLSKVAIELGRRRTQRVDEVLEGLVSSEPATSSAAVAHLEAAAGRLVNRVPGMSDGDYDAEAVKSLAILAFPSRHLPEAVRSAMRSDYWRTQLNGLTGTEQGNISEIVLNSAFAEVDLRALFTLAREGKDRAGEISLLAELGLLPAAYDALLARLERGEDPDGLSMALMRYEYSCTSGPFYSRWITPMRGYDQGCGADAPEDLLSVQQLERLAKYDLAQPLGIALAYLEGRGVEPDSARALAMIERSDSALIEKAVAAAIYEDGRGVAPDPKRAAEFYAQIARLMVAPGPFSQGPVGALATRYGTLLMEGWGVPRDMERAVALFRLGVLARAPRAEVALADALLLGLGIEADEQEALRWYRQAARDEPTALIRFGFLAATRRWEERNLSSRRWYDLAAQAKTPQIWVELARAEAYGPSPSRTEVLRLLQLAAAKKNGWAAQWLAACPRGVPECLKRQPGFARTFFVKVAAGARRIPGPGLGKSSATASVLSRDVDHLRRQIRAAVSRGKGSYELRDRLREIERIQTYHGDVEGAIGTRLRLLLAEDGSFAPDGDSFGASALGLPSANRINFVSEEETAYRSSFGRYRAAMDSSCRWGLASRMAEDLGRRGTALLFAKIAVNRLQEAREFLSGLDSDVRECFLEMHKDRYRWLADLLIQSERLAEAEVVLGMLKDFEQAAYLHDSTRRRQTTRRIAFSAAESRYVSRFQSLSGERAARDGGTTDGPDPGTSAALIFRYEDEGIQDSIDAIARELAAFDLKDGQPASIDRLVRLGSFNRAVVADLQERLPSGTVALHAVVLPDRVHWILATPKGRKSFTIRIRQIELEEAISAFRTAIVDISPDIEERSRRVYALIFEGVDRELSQLGARTVMLSLDRRLRYVPFAALYDGSRWLAEKYAFTTFRQQGDYLRPIKGLPWKVAAFAATRPAFGLDPLPSAGVEIERIVRFGSSNYGILEGQRRVDSEFTRESLMAALKGDFRVVHIASHFVLDPIRDADSFLLLGDGSRLPLADMRASSDFTFSRADLVTLSACQTALGGRYGDGREVDTLGDVAQNAGAPAVLASLWSVDDESTAALMVEFYRRRVSEGVSLAEALRAAQLDMLRQPPKAEGKAGQGPSHPTSHPFYWAAFILSGNGR